MNLFMMYSPSNRSHVSLRSLNSQGSKSVLASSIAEIYNELKNPMKSFIKFDPNVSIKNSKRMIDGLRNSKSKLEAKLKAYRKRSSENKSQNGGQKIAFKLRK